MTVAGSAGSNTKKVFDGTVSKGGLTLFMIVAIAVHVFDTFGGRLSGGNISLFDNTFMFLHLLLVPILGALFMKIKTKEGLALLWGYALTAYLLPIALQIPFLKDIITNTAGVFLYTAILIFMPVWVIFFISRADDEKAKWLSWIIGTYAVVWIVSVLIVFSAPAFTSQNFGPTFYADGMGGLLTTSMEELGIGISQAWSSVVQGANSVQQGITGNVSSPSVARVVTPSDFKAVVLFDSLNVLGASPYTRDNDLEIEARLRTKTLSEDQKVPVTIACTTPGATSDNINIYPTADYVAEGKTEQSEFVSCTINKNILNVGTHKVTLSATYDMQGFSRLTFVAGKDDQFTRDSSGNFKPKNSELSIAMPSATVSSANTPLKVSLGIPERFFVLESKDDESSFNPSITLERTEYNGKGIVHDITIIAPKLLRLDDVRPYGSSLKIENCETLKKKYPYNTPACSDSTEDVYSIDSNNMSVETVARLSLIFKIPKESQERFLKSSAFAQKTMYVLSTYTFTTKKEKSVQIGLSAEEVAKNTLAQFPTIITGPSVQPSATGVRIELSVDRLSKILYTYWDKSEGESKSTASPASTNYENNHVITLSGLNPETVYEMKLDIIDKQNRRTTKNIEFTTSQIPGGPSS